MNQFRPVTMKVRTTPGTHNPRISTQTVTNRLREIGERPPYTMYALYAAFPFWPSIDKKGSWADQILQRAHRSFKRPIKIMLFACI